MVKYYSYLVISVAAIAIATTEIIYKQSMQSYIQHVLLRNKKLHLEATLCMDSSLFSTFEPNKLIEKNSPLLTIFFTQRL
jgi:hypothetical protein